MAIHQWSREQWQGELFRLLVENVQDYAIFIVDIERRVQTWSYGAERLLGYAENEIIGELSDCFFTPEDVASHQPQREMEMALKEGRGDDDRWHVRKDGSLFWASGVMTPLRDEAGRLRGFAKIMRDRTDLKLAQQALQEAEERHRLIAELTADFTTIARVDADGTITVEFASEGFPKVTGYTLEEMNASGGWPVVVHPEDMPAVGESIQHWLAGKQHSSEIRLLTKSGEIRWLTYLGRAVYDPGKRRVTRLITAAQDITERKRNEEQLREHREWLRVTLTSIGDAVIATDTRGCVTFMNPVAESLTGWRDADAQQLPLETVFPIFNELTLEPVENPVTKVLREGQIVGLANHTILRAKDGTERPIDDSAAPIRSDSGEMLGVVLVFRDVTEKRQLEINLQQNEERYRRIAEVGHDGIWLIDSQAHTLYVNQRMAELLGCCPEDMMGRAVHEFCFPEDLPLAQQRIQSNLENKRQQFDFRFRRTDGSELLVLASTSPMTDGDGRIIGALGMFADITERKRAESELRDAQRRFQLVFNQSYAFMGILDPQGTLLEANDAPLQVGRLQREQVIGLPMWDTPWWNGSMEVQQLLKEDIAYARTSGPVRRESIYFTAEGQARVVDRTITPVRNESGAVMLLLISGIDITERKRAELVMQEQQEWLRTVLSSIGDAVIATDGEGRVTFVNPVAESLTGWTEPQAAGHRLEDVFPIFNEQTRLPVENPVAKVLREGKIVGLANHTILRARDGTERPIDDSAAPIRGDGGTTVGVVLTFRDVTEQRQAQEALRKSEESLRAIFQQTQAGIVQCNLDGCFLRVNQRYCEMVERTPQELLQLRMQDITHPDDLAESVALFEQIIKDGKPFVVEKRYIRPDGSLVWVSNSVSLITDGEGNPNSVLAVSVDITERQQAEEALRESEEKFRQLAENIQDVFWMANPREPEVLYVSSAYEQVWGRTRQSLIEQPYSFLDAIHPEDRDRVVAAMQRQSLGEATAEEYRITRPDGSTRWVMDRAFPIKDATGNVYRIAGIAEDITDRRLADEELRYRHELLHAITHNATTAVLMVDGQSRCTFMNPAAEQMTGYTFQEAQGQVLHDLIHHKRSDGKPFPRDECAIQQALPGGSVLRNHEDVFVRKDGTFFPVLCNARPIANDDARRPIGTVIEIRDITLEKQAEAALRESEAYFRELTQNMPIVVWTNLPNQRVDFVNRRWLEMTGQTLDYVLSAPEAWMAALHPEDRDRASRIYLDGIASGEGFTMEARFRRAADGTYRWHLNRAVPLRDVAGNIVKFLGTCTDIDEQKRLETELREADRLKDEFLAMLAHELRNPLAPVRNALHIIKQAGSDVGLVAQVREMAERQVQHMARLLDDLLDVSRISRGLIGLRKEILDVTTVVNRCMEAVRPFFEQRQHQLTVSLPPQPIRVNADPTRLEQILTNLLNNAAKYTDPGGRVWLTAALEGPNVVLRVRDTGIGIAPHMLSKIFDLFVQAERRLDRSVGGVGIGLTLVKRLVELHGGSIEVHSGGLGQGSEFVVLLPSTTEETATAKAVTADATARPLPSYRVLVVDDNTDAADSLALLLQLVGQDVRVAYDGFSGIAIADEFVPSVVILDIGMVGMDGYEVARRLRGNAKLQDATLVAVTGWGQDEDRQRTAEAGFDHHLVKPVEPHVLRRLLSKLNKP